MKTIIISLLAFYLSMGSQAQPSIKKLSNHLDKVRVDWGVPGMSVGIVYQNQVYLNKGFGVKEQGKKEWVDANTQFAIASNTKAFVSGALGTLVMEGKLDWDDPVQNISLALLCMTLM